MYVCLWGGLSSCSLLLGKCRCEHWDQSCQQYACVPVSSTYCSMFLHPQGGGIFMLHSNLTQLRSLQVRVWACVVTLGNLCKLSSNTSSKKLFVETKQSSKRSTASFHLHQLSNKSQVWVTRAYRCRWFRKIGLWCICTPDIISGGNNLFAVVFI